MNIHLLHNYKSHSKSIKDLKFLEDKHNFNGIKFDNYFHNVTAIIKKKIEEKEIVNKEDVYNIHGIKNSEGLQENHEIQEREKRNK